MFMSCCTNIYSTYYAALSPTHDMSDINATFKVYIDGCLARDRKNSKK